MSTALHVAYLTYERNELPIILNSRAILQILGLDTIPMPGRQERIMTIPEMVKEDIRNGDGELVKTLLAEQRLDWQFDEKTYSFTSGLGYGRMQPVGRCFRMGPGDPWKLGHTAASIHEGPEITDGTNVSEWESRVGLPNEWEPRSRSVSIAPLEWRESRWWVHLFLQWRSYYYTMFISAIGGWSKRNLTKEEAARAEIEEEFGAEMDRLLMPGEDDEFICLNRAIFVDGINLGAATFRNPVLKPKPPKEEDEQVAEIRFALPLQSIALLQDNYVQPAVAWAQEMDRRGKLEIPH